MTSRLLDPETQEQTAISVEAYSDVVVFKRDGDDDSEVWALVEVVDGRLAIEVGGERLEWSIADGGRV